MTERVERFQVSGMHCASCEFILEEKLKGATGVRGVDADLKTNSVTVTGEFGVDREELARTLTELVASHGYTLNSKVDSSPSNTREYMIAIPAAVVFILVFVLLQKVGLVNLVSSDTVTYGTAFVIGLIASVSTCLAIVGGLVLSVSANAAKNNGTWRAQILFHVGRLGGFFVLGGIIGVLGKVFQLGFVGTAVLSILVALVMLVLGLNLLDAFPFLRRAQIRMPKLFAHHAARAGESSHSFAPFAAGIITFFLPCGFTQSMQIYTLTTGNYVIGGLTMLAFALGTLPVLLLLSFGALEIAHKPWKGTFFKATGLVVIAMALFNLLNGLVSIGIVSPIFSI